MSVAPSPSEGVDLQALWCQSGEFNEEVVQRALRAATGAQARDFRAAVLAAEASADSDDEMRVRAGVGTFLLGQPKKAAELLSGTKSGLGHFYLAEAHSTLGDYASAAKEYEAAAKAGYQPAESTLRRAGEVRKQGQIDEAEEIVRSTGAEGVRLAEYSYQIGCIMADRGDTFGAIEYFERAVEMDPQHQRALFWLAQQNNLHGNDDEAIRLYERALSRPPYYTGALLNLGLLYEDKENYPAAEYCFQRVLQFDPQNDRARLYLRDIEATGNMYYDEEQLRSQARMEQLLSRPVTDYELSVRSRNCLAGMGINTLGDLTEVTEQELLAGKNFGETSLTEIRELLASHGLTIGQNIHEKADTAYELQDLSPQEQAKLSRPVTDLNLSVRARKCMTRLGITTIGELVSRTPDELLSAKNFGVTSLNEIRAKLAENDMKLRND